jgi:mono/diheme cytochrome c family protein
MSRIPAVLTLALLTGSLETQAAEDPISRGQTAFNQACAPCHGAGRSDFGRAMLPGTDALRIKYQGKLPALLEERTDLTLPVLKNYVRRGSWSMPPFRKSELSDSQIEDIAVYLAVAARKAKP